MSELIKFIGRKVYMGNKRIGEVSFTRGRWGNGQIEVSGYFIFSWEDKKYRFDTSCFGYSVDARKYIKSTIEQGAINTIIAQSKEM